MASASLIPVSEYLRTTYRPDCDYLEGEVRERNPGERPHATIQWFLSLIFGKNRDQWQVQPLPEQRVQVGWQRYRIPDVCVVRRSDSNEPIVHVAPLICIEVLSKDDSLRELQDRVNVCGDGCREHLAVVPWNRVGYYCSRRGFQQPVDGLLRVAGTAIAVELADVFAELDRA